MSLSKQAVRERIFSSLTAMKAEVETVSAAFTDRVSLTAYAALCRKTECGTVWTEALRAAVHEHAVVVIPPAEEIYYIDSTVTLPSNTRIEAHGASIFLTPDCDLLMLRNEHTVDGTHAPVPADTVYDRNIAIVGGTWGESRTMRGGYGASGRLVPRKPGADPHVDDTDRAYYGVSTLFLFLCAENVLLSDLTFVHTAGFSVQTGYVRNCVIEKIRFEGCFADGLHLNGCSENLYIRDVSGEVGDDLVALNMYDWQNSSVAFGPTKNVYCEGLHLAPSSPYKALRILPAIYFYDDNSNVDCGLFDAVIRNVTGIVTFKMYLQTPPYRIGVEMPEHGAVGSSDNLFFEDIVIDLDRPIDPFPCYMNADPVRGAFGAFEFNANMGYVSFEDIDITMYPDRFPNSYLATVGPKSFAADVGLQNDPNVSPHAREIVTMGTEVFDPYVSCVVDTVALKDIRVNGDRCQNPAALLHATTFDDINRDGMSTGSGKIEQILVL